MKTIELKDIKDIYIDASIPNKELREVYSETVGEWLKEKAPEYAEEAFSYFLEKICEGSEAEIKSALERYLNKRSILDGEKMKDLSKDAIKQIEDKKYYKNLEIIGVEKVRLIGISFDKKEAEVTLKEISLI